jgi:hypothetical protein
MDNKLKKNTVAYSPGYPDASLYNKINSKSTITKK